MEHKAGDRIVPCADECDPQPTPELAGYVGVVCGVIPRLIFTCGLTVAVVWILAQIFG